MSDHPKNRLGYCTGSPPRKKTFIRCDTPQRKCSISFQRIDADGNDVELLDDEGKPVNEAIEFLANGQYAVISGLYPGLEKRYRWDGETPTSFPLSKVPRFTFKQIQKLSQAMIKAALATGHYRFVSTSMHQSAVVTRSINNTYSDELNVGDAPPPGYDRSAVENTLISEFVMQDLGFADHGRERTSDSVEECGFIDLTFAYAHLFGDDGLDHYIEISRTEYYPDESEDITKDYLSAKNYRSHGDVKTFALFYAIMKIHNDDWLRYQKRRLSELSLEQFEFHSAELGRSDCLASLRSLWLNACQDTLIQEDLHDALIKVCQDSYKRLGTTPPGRKPLMAQLVGLPEVASSGSTKKRKAIWFAGLIKGTRLLKRDQHGNPYLCTRTQARMLFSSEFKRYATRLLFAKGISADSSTYREIIDLLDAQTPDENVA